MGQARALCYNLSFVYDDLRIYTTSSSALLCSSRRMDYKSSHSLAFVTSQTHFANPLSSIPPNESFFFFFFFFFACTISAIILVRFFQLRCIAFLKQTLSYQMSSALNLCLLESLKRKLELNSLK